MKRKINTLHRWPYLHICPLSLGCWCEWYLYGMPMRIHHKDRFWTIPGPTRWYAEWHNKVMWSGTIGVTRAPSPKSPGDTKQAEATD